MGPTVSVLRRPWAVVLALLVVLPIVVLVSQTPAYAAGTVTVSVQGFGTVTGDGINCTETGAPDCSQFYEDEQVCDPELKPPCYDVPPSVGLTAGPGRNGYVFSHFEGCDEATGNTCTLTVSSNTPVTAIYEDDQAPTVVLTQPSSMAVVRGTFAVAANASDNIGVTKVEFLVGAALISTDFSAPFGTSVNSTLFADGLRTVTARAFDAYGNSTSAHRSVTFDNTAPVLGVSGPDGGTYGPGSTQTWTLSASDATSGVADLGCAVTPVGEVPTFGGCSSAVSHSVTDRPGGSYEFRARATDAAGNITTSAPRTFTIDATPPTSTIVSGPASGSVSSSRTATFAMTASEPGSTFACRAYPVGTTAPAFGACSGGTQHVLAGLADGGHTFEVRATDAVGNVETAPVTRAFVVDGTAPQTSFTKTPKSVIRTRKRKVTVRFGFGASEPGTYRCSLDGKAWTACAPETSFRVRRGVHTLKVVATDAVGNADATPATYRWRVKKKV